jgi:hypothetical protein
LGARPKKLVLKSVGPSPEAEAGGSRPVAQSDAPRHDLPRQPEGEGAVLLFAFGDDLEQQFETGTESCRLYTSKTSTRRKRASRPAGTPLRRLGEIRDGRWGQIT